MEKVKKLLRRYFLDAMGGMAQGLFASLLIGTIISTIGGYIPWTPLKDFLVMIGTVCKNDFVVGAAIGIGMARAMGAAPLVMYSAAAVGAGSYSIGLLFNKATLDVVAHYVPGAEVGLGISKLIAGPGGCFFAIILAVELGMLVSKKTKLDILVTPIVTIIPAMLLARLICPYIAYAMYYLGEFINTVDISGIIDNAYPLIKPYVEKDPTAFYDYKAFEKGVAALQKFCAFRSESISLQLENGETTSNMKYVDASGLKLSDMGNMSVSSDRDRERER